MRNKNGLIWCNVWLTSTNKGKCVIGILTTTGRYKLVSNSSLMEDDDDWELIGSHKPGWYYRYAEKDEITIF